MSASCPPIARRPALVGALWAYLMLGVTDDMQICEHLIEHPESYPELESDIAERMLRRQACLDTYLQLFDQALPGAVVDVRDGSV